ncbi:MAG: hypothetical protein FWB72_00745 [Firmicutes bacterium]|nr:hypothetical protein [Bacillota bacterium]
MSEFNLNLDCKTKAAELILPNSGRELNHLQTQEISGGLAFLLPLIPFIPKAIPIGKALFYGGALLLGGAAGTIVFSDSSEAVAPPTTQGSGGGAAGGDPDEDVFAKLTKFLEKGRRSQEEIDTARRGFELLRDMPKNLRQ